MLLQVLNFVRKFRAYYFFYSIQGKKNSVLEKKKLFNKLTFPSKMFWIIKNSEK